MLGSSLIRDYVWKLELAAVYGYVSGLLVLVGSQHEVVFLSMQSASTLTHSLGFSGPAIDMGLEYVRQTYSSQLSFSLVTYNDTATKTCPDVRAEALPFIVDYYFQHGLWNSNKTVVIIYTPCSDAVAIAADFARELNLPILTTGGVDNLLDSRTRFPTLIRLLPYMQNELSQITADVLVFFGWTDVTVIGDDLATEMNTYSILSREIPLFLRSDRRFTSIQYRHFDFRGNPDFFTSLREASLLSRVFIIISHASRLRLLLIAAAKMGMAKGDYAFLAYEPFESLGGFGNVTWNYGDADDELARQSFRYLMLITTMRRDDRVSSVLHNEMKRRSEEVYRQPYPPNEVVTPFVSQYYQTVALIAQIVAESLSEATSSASLSPINLSRLAWNRWFASPLGSFRVNENGDLDNLYSISGCSPQGDRFQAILRWDKPDRYFTYLTGMKFYWPNGAAPANRPYCGFDGQDPNCLAGKVPAAVPIGVTTCLAVLLGVSVVFWYRRKLAENVDWMIPDEQLTAVHNALPDLIRSMAFLRSTFGSFGFQKALATGSLDMGEKPSKVMQYRGVTVWTSTWEIHEPLFHDEAVRKAIYLRKSLRHPNVADFIGASMAKTRIRAVTEFLPKGSLYQLIESREKPMDQQLKYTLLYDCANALSYIHKYAKFHGSLSSAKCLITGQFSVKVSDFGIPLYHKNRVKRIFGKGEFHKLMWTAPELIRHPNTIPSAAADMYGFGIIMYEILFCAAPYRLYELENSRFLYLSDKDIIDRVQSAAGPPCRPEVPPDRIHPDLQVLMESCWHSEPFIRPSIDHADEVIENFVERSGTSYLENLVWRLEKCSADLEEEVAVRTRTLMLEKDKSERLLRTIFPSSVAAALLSGQSVRAEYYDSCTVAFIVVWNFAEIVANHSPLLVVAVLNDLYSAMDRLVPLHDAYKVETISEAYMVASGVPNRNGNFHAAQVAYLCIEVLRTVDQRTFGGVRTQLQIGVHSGPLVAGIVGTKCPRFCLMGDTVNVASRMATTCEAQKIQTTSSTCEIIGRSKVFQFESRGQVDIKGKGLMETFWLSVAA